MHGSFTDLAGQAPPNAGQQRGSQYACGNCEGPGSIGSVRERPTWWWMGLDRAGQAHYVCSSCTHAFYDVTPLLHDNRCDDPLGRR